MDQRHLALPIILFHWVRAAYVLAGVNLVRSVSVKPAVVCDEIF